MPLTMAGIGTEMKIKKINGRDETKRFLEKSRLYYRRRDHGRLHDQWESDRKK
mgnify:CR=1 FL=1